MLFENKTNSKMLAKLNISENTLKQKHMTYPGHGLDLLEALHTIISPEELIKHRKAFGITKQQAERLKDWLEVNCSMKEYS